MMCDAHRLVLMPGSPGLACHLQSVSDMEARQIVPIHDRQIMLRFIINSKDDVFTINRRGFLPALVEPLVGIGNVARIGGFTWCC